ncbi:NucA/NucB deoxyribonuclease domain-containing protein [Gorillibacterium sp. sgz5001074]|uniref:NucA/NucB deoxyribonuclease domain-containing protein n=1 Tax=Gorillibacterium sp. sgz5001074 TaxID=3446695 RepID=UPI003F67522F
MKRNNRLILSIVVLLVLIGASWYYYSMQKDPAAPTAADIVKLEFPTAKYPETAAHIKEAIQSGESAICTIDREHADEHRKLSLRDIPTKKGYDRDEWPMAMCAEGGAGADIEYITPSDNRGAGSWVSNALEKYPNGTHVQFVIP